MRLTKLLRAKRTPRPKQPNSPVLVVVGLRNPGADYNGTRHNLGYDVVERVIQRSGESFGRAPARLRAMVAQTGFGEDRVLFVAPNTFMNESGGAVRAALSYYKVEALDLLVVHDDIDLPFGRLRVQVAGGSGGHNGIRSIESALGISEFSRLKVGVGRPPGSMNPADFVLRSFTKLERPEVDLMVDDGADVIELWPADRAGAQQVASLRAKDD